MFLKNKHECKLISKEIIPPKSANRFLHWFLRDDLAEEVARHLADRGAALMANHGLLTVGRDIHDASPAWEE